LNRSMMMQGCRGPGHRFSPLEAHRVRRGGPRPTAQVQNRWPGELRRLRSEYPAQECETTRETLSQRQPYSRNLSEPYSGPQRKIRVSAQTSLAESQTSVSVAESVARYEFAQAFSSPRLSSPRLRVCPPRVSLLRVAPSPARPFSPLRVSPPAASLRH